MRLSDFIRKNGFIIGVMLATAWLRFYGFLFGLPEYPAANYF
jgi:hypothetical protein